MKLSTLKSDFILLVVATIWGMAFVAQRVGMDHVGPFTFNAVRFTIGTICLLPLALVSKTKPYMSNSITQLAKSGTIAGFFLFCGISLQQMGLVYTTAGKAGFITGLYVVMVPIMGLFIKQEKTSLGTWIGALLATLGMYFLSVNKGVKINIGDILVLFSTVCFAVHLIIIGRISSLFNTAKLSLVQCVVCMVLSFCFAFSLESFILEDILKAAIPLLYGGMFAVGIAYSLQIYGQKNAPPAHAAIIFSLESVIAALGGWIILSEIMSKRAILGCAMMLSGMLISQVYTLHSRRKQRQAE
ncbi:MAG: DMT family transporter [Desulfobacteraceae bacterium]|nr:DMT family transporter [Desulfobacteraceae bacterium]